MDKDNVRQRSPWETKSRTPVMVAKLIKYIEIEFFHVMNFFIATMFMTNIICTFLLFGFLIYDIPVGDHHKNTVSVQLNTTFGSNKTYT